MPEPVTLSRRDRERLERREAILDAALVLFAEKSYDGTTLEEVAERAEFGKGTLYNYFPGGKEEILFALFARVQEGIGAVMDAAFRDTAGAPARDRIRTLIERLLAHFLGQREQFQFLAKEEHRVMLNGAERAGDFRRQAEGLVDRLAPHLEAMIAGGALRPLPPRGLAHTLLGNVHGYLMFACGAYCPAPNGQHMDWTDPAAAADFLTSILGDGILASPR